MEGAASSSNSNSGTSSDRESDDESESDGILEKLRSALTSRQPNKEEDSESEPATSSFEQQSDPREGKSGLAASPPNSEQKSGQTPDEKELSGTPHSGGETSPGVVDETSSAETRAERARANTAHRSHYIYDEADTDVVLRREIGLDRYFPFELKSYASGEGQGEIQQGDVFAGFDVRDRVIHTHEDNPTEPIWIGYDKEPLDGLREIGWEQFGWFRHATIFGTTGKGKSTLLNIILNQIARKGYGFLFIDPKGDTVDDLIQQLPEDRLDDVIWIEPGSERFDKVAGINFLEPGSCTSESEFDREVESIVDDLIAVLRGGDYWGPRMEGITKNIARAMIRSQRNFTLVDMYSVLIDPEARAQFAQLVSYEGMDHIQEFTKKIAQMDEEEIEPLLRRIQDWVEDPISRGIVAHRDGTINISDAVESGKIILVKNTVQSEEIRQVVSTGILRRVWATIRKREKLPEAEREPFFTIIDEFDDVANENMALDKMLSKARSGKMGVITCLQNPSQLEMIAPQTLKQMFANSDTMISFGVTERANASLIASRFNDDDIDYSTFMDLPPFVALTQVTVMGEDGPKITPPLAPETFADYPPRRTIEDAQAILEANLDEYGVEPLEDDKRHSQNSVLQVGDDAEVVTSFLEALWAEQIRQDALDVLPPEYETLDPAPPQSVVADGDQVSQPNSDDGARRTMVAAGNLEEGFERRAGVSLAEFRGGIAIPEEFIKVVGEDDSEPSQQRNPRAGAASNRVTITDAETMVSITDRGIRAVLEQAEDHLRSTEKHNEVIRRAFVVLSALGFEVTIPVQSSRKEVPDAIAYPAVPETVETREAERVMRQFRDRCPIAAELSDGRPIAIEAETQTYKKPGRTLTNLTRAVNQDQQCLFVVPALEADDRSSPATRLVNILSEPKYIRDEVQVLPTNDGSGSPQNTKPKEFYYNKPEALQIGDPTDRDEKYPLLEKGSESVWVRTGENEVTLYNGRSNAERRGTLNLSEKTGSTTAFEYWARRDTSNDEWVVSGDGRTKCYKNRKDVQQEWQFVREPFIPEREFKEVPDDLEWDLLQVELPEFLSPAGDGDVEDAIAEHKERYSNIDEVPEETWVTSAEFNPGSSGKPNPDLVRGGFTREVVPIPDKVDVELVRDKISKNTSQNPNRSVDPWTDEAALSPIIPEADGPTYEGLSALAFEIGETTPFAAEASTVSNQNTQSVPDESDSTAATSDGTPDSSYSTATLEEILESETTSATIPDLLGGEVEIDSPSEEEQSPEGREKRVAYSEQAMQQSLQYLQANGLLTDDSCNADPKIRKEAVDTFGPNDPTQTETWRRIWERVGLKKYNQIYKERFLGAVQHAGLFSPHQQEDAINIGIVSGALIEVGGEGEAVVRLPGPRDHYSEYLTDDQIEKYKEYSTWESLWDEFDIEFDPESPDLLDIKSVCTLLEISEGIESEEEGRAVIGAGVSAGVLAEHGKEIAPGERRIPRYWREVIQHIEKDKEDTLLRPTLLITQCGVHGVSKRVANKTLDLTIQDGLIYAVTEKECKFRDPQGPEREQIREEAFEPDRYPVSSTPASSPVGPDGDDGKEGDNSPPSQDDSDAGDDDSQSSTDESSTASTGVPDEDSKENVLNEVSRNSSSTASKRENQKEEETVTIQQGLDTFANPVESPDNSDDGSSAGASSEDKDSVAKETTHQPDRVAAAKEDGEGDSTGLHEESTVPTTQENFSEDASVDDPNESSGKTPTGLDDEESASATTSTGVTPAQLEDYYESNDGYSDTQQAEKADEFTFDDAVTLGAHTYEESSEGSPLKQFLENLTVIDESVDDPTDSELAVPKKDLRKAYNVWAKAASNASETEIKILAPNVFGKRLSKQVETHASKRRFEKADSRLNCYVGLALTEEAKQLLEIDFDG